MMLEIIVLLFLLAISLIDLKIKSVPAVFTTSMIFILAIFNYSHIEFAILSSIFAVFLIESDFVSGIADLKACVIVGFMLNSLSYFLLFILLIMLYGFIYKVLMKKLMNQKLETAFLPVFFAVYLTLFIIMLIRGA